MNRKMLGATSLFCIGTIVGTVISFQEDIPGEPLGYTIPGKVLEGPAGRLIVGSGISAPWIMPITCLVAAVGDQPDKVWPKRMIRTVASALVVGQLIERVSWELRYRKPQVMGMAAFNLLCAAALIASARETKL